MPELIVFQHPTFYIFRCCCWRRLYDRFRLSSCRVECRRNVWLYTGGWDCPAVYWSNGDDVDVAVYAVGVGIAMMVGVIRWHGVFLACMLVG